MYDLFHTIQQEYNRTQIHYLDWAHSSVLYIKTEMYDLFHTIQQECKQTQKHYLDGAHSVLYINTDLQKVLYDFFFREKLHTSQVCARTAIYQNKTNGKVYPILSLKGMSMKHAGRFARFQHLKCKELNVLLNVSNLK